MTFHQRTLDTLLALDEGSTYATATTHWSTPILDIGGGAAPIRASTPRVFGVVEVNVTAMVVNDGDEDYVVRLMGSNTSTVNSGNVILGIVALGNVNADFGPNGKNMEDLGRYIIPFCNEVAGTTYRYLRLATTITGTTPSITLSAYLTKATKEMI